VDLGGPYDLIALNIGARPARELRPVCDAMASPGARLVISGLAEWAAPDVAAEYARSGWRTRLRVQAGSEWVTLALDRG
jgi:ribosomal protein L11 methyltransferase